MNPRSHNVGGRPVGRLPLAGIRVVITRPRAQAGALLAAYRQAGAEAVELPLLEVIPPADPCAIDKAAASIGAKEWIVFTSANAVHAFAPRVSDWPRQARVAAVGEATARALAELGIDIDLLPERGDAEGLADELAHRLSRDTPVLVPQAADARPLLVDKLRGAGALVEAVVAYDKRLPEGSAELAARLFDHQPLGWVTFTSPRIARTFAELLGAGWELRRGELRALSIGRVTSAELRRLGALPAAEAERPSDEHLVAATIAAVRMATDPQSYPQP